MLLHHSGDVILHLRPALGLVVAVKRILLRPKNAGSNVLPLRLRNLRRCYPIIDRQHQRIIGL